MEESQTHRPVILVVDDLEGNIHLLKRLLEPKGYVVHGAMDGASALASVDEHPPDVVLLDLVMPGMNGFEVCERLKRSPRTCHLPVIIITGLAEHEANIRALDVGADDFLLRPIDPVLLEARIRSSFRAKAMQDAIIQYQRRLEEANIALEGRVRERTSQIERIQRVTVFSLARLAESRDPETGQHLDRMRRYVREIALELGGLPDCPQAARPDFAEQLYHSSPLHDIGKVGIPDGILLKPGRLTPHEFEIMKFHAVIGGDTLKAADEEAGRGSFLDMGRDIAYHHHERWDGSGYPYGLRGDDIPLAARIVALGDAYDAMRSKRPYKEPFSHEKTRDLILGSEGSHFDPRVVRAFLAREAAFIRIADEYGDSGEVPLLQRLMGALDSAGSA